MENEYVIINKTAMLKKIAELDKGLETQEEANFEINILHEVLSQSTPLIPQIAQAIMWIYEKYGVWITVQPTSRVGVFQFRTFYNNGKVVNQHWNNSMSKKFKSPTEAYEAAIQYTLAKLI